MGSTFPLLEIDEITFSCVGVTAEILATGCLPIILISTVATTTAKAKKVSIRFRNARSML
jgi:hypothetical protein